LQNIMKRLKKVLSFLLIVLFFTSCGLTTPIAATSNPIGSKVGKATATSLLCFPPVADGRSSILRAAKNGGITKISTVDYSFKWMIFISTWTTIVTGE